MVRLPGFSIWQFVLMDLLIIKSDFGVFNEPIILFFHSPLPVARAERQVNR
jgi:hypothetical protein